VPSWDAQKAGLAREDICGDNDKGDIDTMGVEDTAILDQAQQQHVRKRKLIAIVTRAEKLTDNMPPHKVVHHLNTVLTFNRAQTFLTDRQPIRRLLSTEIQTIIYEWFGDSQISVGELDGSQQTQVDFFFVLSYSHEAYLDYGSVHFLTVSPPLSSRWQHVASFPLPSAQACLKKIEGAPTK